MGKRKASQTANVALAIKSRKVSDLSDENLRRSTRSKQPMSPSQEKANVSKGAVKVEIAVKAKKNIGKKENEVKEVDDKKQTLKRKKTELNSKLHTEVVNSDNDNCRPSSKKVGAHVSVAGGLHNAVANALEIGATAFAMFLRNQRQWNSKALEDEDAEVFKQALIDANFSPDFIVPHGIYLVNLASPDEEILAKSRLTLIDELKRCEKLGLKLYNLHPGSTCGKTTVKEGINQIAKCINDAHKETEYVVTLLENMCRQGDTIGGKFEELKAIIDKVEDKERIGICFDTCHAFAAGYDLSTREAFNHTMDLFDQIIGAKYLKAVHLNDSKGECACHLDRHENIGHGKIGMRCFKALMNDEKFNNIPMILETPETDYAKEISKLYSLVGKK